MNLKFIYKLISYILGIFIMAFAVVFILRSTFGSGGWDAFNANFSLLTNEKVTIGQSSMMVGLTFLLIILLYRRRLKYLFSLFPILVTGYFVDLWDLIILTNFNPSSIYLKSLVFIIGIIMLPLGLSLMIQSNLSPMVYDEFTYILMEVFKTDSFSIVRIVFEIATVTLAIIIGLIHNGSFNEVSFGTIIISFLLGPIINMWNKLFIKIKYKEKLFNEPSK